MQKYIDQLKPKANKLLAFVTNWQLAKPEKNIELSRAIVQIMNKGVFPSPIRTFFRLPQFKKLLGTMEEEGKLFIMPDFRQETEEDESHPPIEIQNIQIMVEALHKLVHLDYNRQSIKEPAVYAKVLADNILDYLSAVNMFIPFEGKIVDEILDYLFKSLRKISEKLKTLIEKNPDDFSDTLLKLINEPVFNLLLHIDSRSYHENIIEEWHPILVELNLDAKLSQLTKQLNQITAANTHKLLNQLKYILDEKRQFYQRNTPRYIPRRLKKIALEKIEEEFSADQKIMGQSVNEIFYDEFLHQKYEVIEARQLGINNKFKSYAEQLWPIKKSLLSLVKQYDTHLPPYFSEYFQNNLRPISTMLDILGKPNHLAVQLTSGFYSVQLDYMSDLITQTKHTTISKELKSDIQQVVPVIHSFFEMYYAHRPNPSFKTIKSALENIYVGDEAMKVYSLEEVKEHIDEVFSHLLPLDKGAFISLEANLNKIIKATEEMTRKLPSHSLEAHLLQPIYSDLLHLDLPSFSQSWHTLGSLLSVFYIILSKVDPNFENSIQSWMFRLKKSNFFQMMFYQS